MGFSHISAAIVAVFATSTYYTSTLKSNVGSFIHEEYSNVLVGMKKINENNCEKEIRSEHEKVKNVGTWLVELSNELSLVDEDLALETSNYKDDYIDPVIKSMFSVLLETREFNKQSQQTLEYLKTSIDHNDEDQFALHKSDLLEDFKDLREEIDEAKEEINSAEKASKSLSKRFERARGAKDIDLARTMDQKDRNNGRGARAAKGALGFCALSAFIPYLNVATLPTCALAGVVAGNEFIQEELQDKELHLEAHKQQRDMGILKGGTNLFSTARASLADLEESLNESLFHLRKAKKQAIKVSLSFYEVPVSKIAESITQVYKTVENIFNNTHQQRHKKVDS
eukprot:m.15839 g.15839  ORF g.15839 m.15839 type:complete len:341 (+) comp5507_c0_seq1:136-1158(+)